MLAVPGSGRAEQQQLAEQLAEQLAGPLAVRPAVSASRQAASALQFVQAEQQQLLSSLELLLLLELLSSGVWWQQVAAAQPQLRWQQAVWFVQGLLAQLWWVVQLPALHLVQKSTAS